MISLISSLSLKIIVFKLIVLWSKRLRVFVGNLQQSLEIFGNCSGTFVWPWEQFWKIFRNLRKIVKNAVTSISMFLRKSQYLTCLLHSLARYCSCHWNIKFISFFLPPCNILYIYSSFVNYLDWWYQSLVHIKILDIVSSTYFWCYDIILILGFQDVWYRQVVNTESQ